MKENQQINKGWGIGTNRVREEHDEKDKKKKKGKPSLEKGKQVRVMRKKERLKSQRQVFGGIGTWSEACQKK